MAVYFIGKTQRDIENLKIFAGSETIYGMNEDENYAFELDTVLLEIMPYGIAADLLKMDMISSYGRHFYERYLEMKNNIDPRKTKGIIRIEGGANV